MELRRPAVVAQSLGRDDARLLAMAGQATSGRYRSYPAHERQNADDAIQPILPRLRLRLIITLPVFTSISALATGLLITSVGSRFLAAGSPLATHELNSATVSVLLMSLSTLICSSVAAVIISRQMRRLIVKAGSLIGPRTRRAVQDREIEAGSELDALGVMLDEATVTLNGFIHDSYILENLPEAVVTIDQDGSISSLNRKAARLLGRNIWEIKGKSLKEFIPETFVNGSFYRHVQTGLSGAAGTSSRMLRVSINGRKNQLFWIGVNAIEEGGGSRKTTITLKDQSDIVAVRNQIQKLERLAAVGRVSAHIAHEVRNPLGSIRALAELTQQDLPPDDPRRMFMGTVLGQVDRLNHLVEDVLAFSRDTIFTIEKVDLRLLLSQAVSIARGSMPAGSPQVFEHYDTRLPRIIGDSQRLTQAFLNILINAFEATQGNGSVSIFAGFETCGREDNRIVSVKVVDSGKGIPAESLGKIFEPFYTTKAAGTGLGLAISYHIISAHGGHVEVFSQENKGTTFHVLLPEKSLVENHLEKERLNCA